MASDAPSPEHQSLIDTLIDAVVDFDIARAVEVLAPLDEAARSAIHPQCVALCGLLRQPARRHELPPAIRQRLEAQDVDGPRRRLPVMAALELGLGPRPTFGFPMLWERPQAADLALAQVLIDRRPSWLCAWLQTQVDEEATGLSWTLVDAVARAGVCPRPASSETFLRLMAWSWFCPSAPPDEPAPQAFDTILAEPERLDASLWELFSLDVGSRLWFSEDHADETSFAGREGLATTLRRLIDAGHVARERVLDATLDALAGSRDASQRKSFIRFLKDLSVSETEVDERQAAYRALLGTGAGPVVDFGLAQLGRLVRPGRLDIGAFADAVAPAFTVSGQATVQRAVKLVAKLVSGIGDEDDDGLRERLLASTVDGLLHPKAPVAEATVALLEAHVPLPPTVRGAIDALRPAIAGALVGRVDPLLGSPTTSEISTDEDLPPGFPEPRKPAPLHPDLTTLATIRPLADRDALIDAAAHAAETVSSCEEIERLLDGLSRFGSDRSDPFGERVEALAHRLGDAPSSESGGPGLAKAQLSIGRALGDLLRVWLTGRSISVDPFYGPPKSGPFGFLACRIQEIRGRLTGARPSGPLLSLPTHVGGWIDPSVLVDRLRTLGTTADAALVSADGALALSRLAPGDPACAAELPGLAGRLIRGALGSDDAADRPQAEDDPRLWVVAARVRSPDGDLSERLAPLGDALDAFTDKPDAVMPASWSWRFEPSFGLQPYLVLASRTEHRSEPLTAGAWRPPSIELVDLAFSGQAHTDIEHAWNLAWLASIWPARVDAFLFGGARLLNSYFTDLDARSRPFDAFFEPLADPRRSWPTAAEPLIALALIARGKVARAAAVDVLIDALEDGRADAGALGRGLGRCIDAILPPLGRVTGALDEISRVSPLHEHAVFRLIDGVLDHWGTLHDLPDSNGLAGFLRLAEGLAVAQGEAVSDGARAALAKITGGQAGRLARKLLAHERLADAPRRLEARRAAWAARLDLA
ncbi:MAG: DUF6493 family protein [Acidobacteriota bacterium]